MNGCECGDLDCDTCQKQGVSDYIPAWLSRDRRCNTFSEEQIAKLGVETLRYINEHGKLPDCKPNTFARSLNTKDWGSDHH